MPFPNEHSCRLRDPNLFVRIVELYDEKGRRGIGGPLKSNPSGPTVTQAVRYDKAVWSAAEAAADCRRQGGSFEAASAEACETESLDKADYLDPAQNPLLPKKEE